MVTWLNRGTLHLVRSEDYWWLHRLTAHRVLPGVGRRLRQLGVEPGDEDRGVGVVVDALGTEGPLARNELRDRLDAAGVPTAGQALVHLLAAASLRGHVVRGRWWTGTTPSCPSNGGSGPRRRPAAEDDLDRLARRYLAGHGPAAAEDLAAWAGITLGDARRRWPGWGEGTQATDGGVVLRPAGAVPGGAGRAAARALRPGAARLGVAGAVRRRPRFGGHLQRHLPGHLPGRRPAWSGPGPCRPAARWSELFEEVDAADRVALAAEARDVVRFLGHGGGPVTFTAGSATRTR